MRQIFGKWPLRRGATALGDDAGAGRLGLERSATASTHGLPIGSKRVEAGCKNIAGRRMKDAGLRRSVAGANPVLWLRCARQGRTFDDYWKARIDRLAA